MADADGMDVHEGTEELIHIQLDLEHGHGLLELGIVPAGAVHRLWDVFKHKVEVHFIFLSVGLCQKRISWQESKDWRVLLHRCGERLWSLPCHH